MSITQCLLLVGTVMENITLEIAQKKSGMDNKKGLENNLMIFISACYTTARVMLGYII